MIARDLLAGIAGVQVIVGSLDRPCGAVQDDSRRVAAGDLFVAVPGTKIDARLFLPEVIAKSVAAVVSEGPFPAELIQQAREKNVTLIQASQVRRCLGVLAARRSGATAKLCLSAVTGTNGKTTTTHLVESMLNAAGRRPGIIGTVGYRFAGATTVAPLTTPGALALHEQFGAMLSAGATDVVLEASSIALDQGRLDGCSFRVVSLTNVTQDHLDYHSTMDAYFAAKARLFHDLLDMQSGVGVLLIDREEGRRMRPQVRGRALTVSAATRGADVVVRDSALSAKGIRATFETPLGIVPIASALVGDFNLENILVAVGMGIGMGLSAQAISVGLSVQTGVPGRLERVLNNAGVLCVVDYAHTPDALERALGVLRPLTSGRVIVVFGCGGDRDTSKRPLMGAAAGRLGDLVIVTSDNPRSEDPQTIAHMILPGLRQAQCGELSASDVSATTRGYVVELDRRAAIRMAIGAARSGDVVLVAGKGHEDYQIVGTSKTHFDDREEAAAAFAARTGAGA